MMRRNLIPYFIAALLSVLLSFIAAIKSSVINPDAVCYLQSAAAMQRGFSTAMHLCEQAKWPFYSAFIFGIVKLTHLSYLSAAMVLNAFFSLLTVMVFMAIVNTVTKNPRMVWLAGIVILLANGFNNIRIEIIRDHGYWAFYLFSLLFFLSYFQNRRFLFAILWSAALIIASLFRIEGVMFLLLLPLTVFFDARQKIKGFLQLNCVTLIFLALLIAWVLSHPGQGLGRLTEVQFQLAHGLNHMIGAMQTTSQALIQHVLNGFSAHDVRVILLSMWTGYYLANVIASVSLIYAVLIIYAWIKKLSGFQRNQRLAIWAYILVNVLITAIFLIENQFLSKRYLIALSLVLMLWVPFALNALITMWRIRKWPLIFAVFFISIYAVGGIVEFGYSKKYIRDAGEWMASHTADTAKIYSNDYQLMYYSHHFGDAIFTQGQAFLDLKSIEHGQWRNYDYLALQIENSPTPEESALLQEIHLKPIKIFQNEHGDQVRIYQVQLTQ